MTSFLGKLIVLAATTAGLTRLSRLLRGDSGRAGPTGPRDDKTSQPAETPASARADAAEAVDDAAAGPAPAAPKTDAQGVADQDVPSSSNAGGAGSSDAEVVAKPDAAPKSAAPLPAEDPLAAKHRAAPFDRNFRSVDYTRLSQDRATIAQDRARQRRMHSTWSPPPPDQRRPAEPSQSGVFSNFGGSVIAAEVIRGGEAGRVPDPMPQLPGERIAFSGPHPDAPTPDLADREGIPADPLAVKHRSERFDQDFRTVDYANLDGGEATPGMVEDGSAVPPALTRVTADDGTYVAAFRTAGGPASLRGAPASADMEPDPDADSSTGGGGKDAGVEAAPDVGAVDGSVTDAGAGAHAPDDLTQIKGIGPTVERLLFEQGIFRYDQIAALGESEIAAIEAAIGFSGRIGREAWVEQARALSQGRAAG
ncbi:hypothetical protein SI859A1_01081 [Aurantimonas manganoxydans SI85-9A1]|uniref:Uncharacterized protein n=1 Tax=Aurantimonas manganoxydans (strain ATCC BAA-1229 / DSM 21871 / SI85-9A1) TaxID=287752 RepID=Q1YEJ4_AURMS|nr:hypothetical protein [Aurantimonas manganoxydans]EAS48597.1 hypothetical protein SI859A1_01081 [Aurantimonas manganoxydans SI85-9A1]